MDKSSSFYILIIVASYWIISISTVFINKYLLSDNSAELNVPFFITWFQAVCSVIIVLATKMFMRSQNMIQDPVASIDLSKCWRLVPLSIVFCGMTSFNNLSLQYLGIAFYYVARSLSTIFNVIFTYALLRGKTSLKAIGCCGLLMIGYIIGSVAENEKGKLSYWGLFFGVMASACVALNSILTKKFMNEVESNIWSLSLYNNINCCVIFIPIILIAGEHHSVYDSNFMVDHVFWALMFLGGVFGFSIGFVAALQIKYTSPLTHNVSGTAKAAFQTILGVIVYTEVKSAIWWFGNALVLVSSSLYTYVRHREMNKPIITTKEKELLIEQA
ncbi:hypothetical protein Ciccas_003607 [Cichlidogyrus casuarinus]|uniref:Sugar phosphate transporter domain-containing protein n=1 Tax=Cichlidogyrus casuarinus TaxID=1844966 RepID=A0ABD2QDW8_9PLAT